MIIEHSSLPLFAGLQSKIFGALEKKIGKKISSGDARLSIDDLAPLDQFHTLGKVRIFMC